MTKPTLIERMEDQSTTQKDVDLIKDLYSDIKQLMIYNSSLKMCTCHYCQVIERLKQTLKEIEE